ncbi:hypothetical protein EPN90_03590 [Patescibacteria group bacterium]|nr:MAG: hypothetical protein EPN90_03590 [Patescibacteria group bacterium]
MALEPHEQFLEAARRSQRILIALPHLAGVDETAAGLTLRRLLRAQGKSVDTVGDGFVLRPEHGLLPDAETIKSHLPGLANLVITLPLGPAKLANLHYAVSGDELKITLTPEKENWSPEQVRAEPGRCRYDLAITVGCPDHEALGALWRQAPEFWRSVPVANLDHSPTNEHYGNINLVDLTAASVSEVVAELLARWPDAKLDRALSTALLAGVIAKTKSFKTGNVSPRTLATAAKLVEDGADRERIVAELYRTRTVTTLRLWGRALARLRQDSEHKIAWALLTRQDFVAAGGGETELAGVLDELIAASPEVAVSFVLYENNAGGVSGLLHTNRNLDALQLVRDWAPTGAPRQAAFAIGGISLLDAEKLMLQKIRVELKG